MNLMNTFKETSPSLKLRLKSLAGSPAKSPRQSTSCRPARCKIPQQPHQTTTSLSDINSDPASVYYLHTSKVCLKTFLKVRKCYTHSKTSKSNGLYSLLQINRLYSILTLRPELRFTSDDGFTSSKNFYKTRRLCNSEVNFFSFFTANDSIVPL